MAADETVHIDLEATDEVSGPARAAIESLDDLGSAASGAAPKVKTLDQSIDSTTESTQDLERRLALAERRIKSMGNEAIKSAAKIQALQRKLDRVNRAGSNNPFGGSGKKGGMFGGITAGFKFSGFLKLIMIPTVLDAVGAVATLGSALGAMGAAAVGGLAPLGGLLAAYPGMMAAIGQGYAVMSLGFSGLGAAITALNNPEASPEELAAALKDLPPNVQRLAKEVSLMNKPFKDLKYMVGDELAPGFILLTKSARGYIPLLEKALTGTARVMSSGAASLGAFLNKGNTKNDVKQLMSANTEIIRQLIRAALPGIRALLNIMTAAGPMLVNFARDFADFMEKVAGTTDNRSGLIKFFDKTYEITKEVTGVLSDLGAGLYTIFKQGASLGGEMGDVIIRLAQSFRDWADSSKGQEQIANWFTKMKPVIWEVGYLIRDIVKALATVTMDDTVVTTLQTLRNDTLPAITTMLQSASGKFLPSLARIIGTIAQIMNDLQIGPIVLEMIASSLELISGFIQGLPAPVKSLLGYMVTLMSVIKYDGFLAFFNIFGAGGAKSVGLLKTAFNLLKTAFNELAFAIAAVHDGAATAGEAVGMLGESALGGLGAGIAAYGPMAAAALVAAIGIAAWQSSQKIREMQQKTAQLNAELAKTGSSEAFANVTNNLDDLQNKLDNLWDSRDSYSDLLSGGYWFSTDTYRDIGAIAGHVLKAAVTGEWGDGPKLSIDYIQDEIDKSEAALVAATRTAGQLANDIFGTNMSYAENAPEVQKIRAMAEAAGVDLTQGYDKARDAIQAFYNVNYKATPAVKSLYDSLKTLGDSAATSADKLDAFASTFEAVRQILTGGSSRDALVQSAKGIDGLSRSMDNATVSFRNGKVVFDAAAKSNWELHDALQSQASSIETVATKTYEETGSIKQATAAYREQYQTLVGQVAKGLGSTRKEAKLLVDQYALTPKQVTTVFNDPGLMEMIENGATAKEIADKINGMTVTPKVKPKVEIGKLGVKGTMQLPQYGQVNKQLKEMQEVLAEINKPITTKFKPVNLDPTLLKAAELATTLDEMPLEKEITITTTYKTKGDPPRALGGPVAAGQRYLVGEVGPEVYVSHGGTRTLIGAHGPERRRFPADGHIIPNHELPSIHRESALATAVAEHTLTREHGESKSEQYDTLPPIQVFIDTINADSEVDIEVGIERGIRNWFRNERERR